MSQENTDTEVAGILGAGASQETPLTANSNALAVAMGGTKTIKPSSTSDRGISHFGVPLSAQA